LKSSEVKKVFKNNAAHQVYMFTVLVKSWAV